MNIGSVLGKVLLGCAGISIAVCAYKLYSSKKNEKVQTSSGPSESANVELDGMFVFYVDNKFSFNPLTKGSMEFSANEMFVNSEDVLTLDVWFRNIYKQHFGLSIDGSVSRYDGLKLTFCSFVTFYNYFHYFIFFKCLI